MKRLGIHTFAVLFLCSFLFITTPPEAAYAQTQPTKTVAQYEAQGKVFFNQLLQILAAKKADPNPPGTIAVPVSSIDALIKTTEYASNNFSSYINASTDVPSTAYEKALFSAVEAVSASQRANPGTLRTPYATTVIKQFTAQLNDEALAAKKAAALSGSYTPTQIETLRNDLTNARAEALKTTVVAKESQPLPCNIMGGAILGCIDAAVTYIIKNILLELAGWFLWLTANILNYAMRVGIFEFKLFAPDTIYGMWLVVRQAVSLFIFFAGLFIGFMSVIGKSEEFKKYIAFFVVFGLFVNFSYPVVRLMIDVSNVVSLQIYETTLGPGVILANTDSGETAGARIVSALGLNGLAAGATTIPGKSGTSDFINQLTTTPGALLAVIFVAYSGYVLFMMAALIVARTVLLVFLIIASPLLLVDTVVPALGEKAAWLRKQLFSQLAVAPVFMIMLALTLRFLEVFRTTGIINTTGSQVSSIAVFFNIAIMLAMMHLTLKVTKSVAGSIGEGVTNWAGKAGGLATGMAFRATAGATGFVGRQTVGRAAGALAQTDTVKNWAGTWMGDTVGKGLSKVGGAKYDLRNLTTVGKAAGFAGMRGMGAGASESFAEQQSKKNKAITEQARDMTNTTARTAFLDRKLGSGSILKDPLGELGARGGQKLATKLGFDMPQTSAEKTRTTIAQEDTDTLKKYATANKKEREKMMADDANKLYQNRFAQIDTYLNPNTPQADKDIIKASMEESTSGAVDILKAGEQKQAEIKARNEARLADYGTADVTGREAIRTAFANDEQALQQIDILQKLSAIKSDSVDAVQQKTEELKKLKELAGEDLVLKVIARDTHEGITDRNAAIAQKTELYQNMFTDPVTGSVDPRISIDPFIVGKQYDDAIAKRNGVTQAQTEMKQAEIDALKINAQASQDLAKTLQQVFRSGAFRQTQQAAQPRPPQRGSTPSAQAAGGTTQTVPLQPLNVSGVVEPPQNNVPVGTL